MIRKFFLLLLIIIFASCSKLYLAAVTSKEVKTETFYNKELNKTLVCFPMVHLNKPGFYEDVKMKLNVLRDEGYVVFYEGVKLDNSLYSNQEIDTLHLKFRKLIGFTLTNYKDSTNLSLPKAIKNNKYSPQTREAIGITENDKLVDVRLDSLIYVYEEKYGEIQLTECDYNTPQKQKYDCEKLPRFNEILVYHRNQHILNEVRNSKFKKIALVYGKKHFTNALYGSFQKNGYEWLD